MDFIMLQQNHFKMFLPEVFLATSILILTLYTTYTVSSVSLGFPVVTRSLIKVCVLTLVVTLFLQINNSIDFMVTYQSTFIFDSLTTSSKSVVIIFSIVCLLIFEEALLKQQINNFEYLLLILSAVLGLMLLVSSFDMISLYLAIEMQSLCLYAMAAAKKESTFSTEAGLKYFILGSFSSALLLFGISLLYGCTGTTSFEKIALLLSFDLEESPLRTSINVAIAFIASSFFFKIAAAPFHMWSPDVYEGSPVSSTIFFAIVPKIALFTVFLRLFQTVFFSFFETFLLFLIMFSVVSVVIGSFVALKQKKNKKTVGIQLNKPCRIHVTCFFGK